MTDPEKESWCEAALASLARNDALCARVAAEQPINRYRRIQKAAFAVQLIAAVGVIASIAFAAYSLPVFIIGVPAFALILAGAAGVSSYVARCTLAVLLAEQAALLALAAALRENHQDIEALRQSSPLVRSA